MKLFLYKRVKKYVSSLDTVSEVNLQRMFGIGYAKASNMIERLAADGTIAFKDGKWCVPHGLEHDACTSDVLVDVKHETEEQDTLASDSVPEFTKENVLELIKHKGEVSTSLIQRHFMVGYGIAVKMMDELAEEGYIDHDGTRWVVKTQ